MSDSVELNKAIMAHSNWIVRLRDAVEHSKSDLTVAQAGDPHACAFGKWLDSLSPADKMLEEYKTIIPLHNKFHSIAANLLQMALTGQKEKVLAELTNMTGEYMYTSAQLVNALNEWKRKST